MRTHHTRSDSTARLAPAGVLAAAIAAVAGLATTSPVLADWQMQSVADERVRQITVEFETDCLFWDLCWSRQKDDHREAVAQAIADQMDDPQALYVISMPQLPRHWEPVGRGRLVGMDGRTINRGRLRNFIRVYESVTDRALMAIMDHLDQMRPGAVFSFEDFRLTTNEHNPYPAYVQYDENADFITQIVGDDRMYDSSNGDYDEWLDDNDFEDDQSVLFNTPSGWMLADADGILNALDDEPDGDVYVAWGLPDPNENHGGGTASNPESGEPDREEGLTTIGRALAMGGSLGVEGSANNGPDGAGVTPPSPPSPPDDGGSDDEPSGGDQGESSGDGDPGDETDLGANIRVLQGGDGWTGPTDGNDAGAIVGGDGPKPIARWNVVPYQDFTGRFEIGVVAFHIDGIERVSFSVDNGPWVHAEDMVLNPRTGVVEYAVALEAAAFDDGPVEVRAIVVPTEGPARVLGGPHDMSQDDVRIRGEHSLFLNANANGTLQQPVRWVSPAGSDESGDGTEANPFRSIAQAAGDIQDDFGSAEGGTVYLREGEYDYGQTSFRSIPETRWRWLTIAGAPDADREDVRIVSTSGNGLRTDLVRFENITLHGATPQAASASYPRVWADEVIMQGDGPLDGTTILRGASWSGGYYATDSIYRDMQRGVREAQLVRDIEIYNLGADAFREMRGLAVNVEVRDLLNLDGTHNDVMQFYSNAGSDPFENVILYNFKAVENIAGQAFFMRTSTDQRDFAIVNYVVASTGSGGAQWTDSADHVLMWNYQQLNNGFIIRDEGDDDPTTITNYSVRDSVFQMFRMTHTGSWPTMSDQSWAENNHYIDMETFATLAPGEGATTGGSYETLFVDPDNFDFRPAFGSILTRRDTDVAIPLDADGVERGTPGAIGALTEPSTR